MRMKIIVENRTLKGAVAEFLVFKRAQIIPERTLHDCQKYINPFIEQSSNSMDAAQVGGSVLIISTKNSPEWRKKGCER